MSFLIPLAIALVAIYIQYQTQEEIVAIFSIVIAIVCFFLSLVLAPWMVQILILVAGLGGMRYFCRSHSCQDAAGKEPDV
ncbi:hypothetical protein [Egbenema bharatensis]|uniref:hypothetical protein n=1 Tax=Egbenema bharatensis TaxID=3463334 RepID=UPI003A8ABD95